jgi:hypothetical protein
MHGSLDDSDDNNDSALILGESVNICASGEIVFMIPDGTVLWKRRLKDTLAYRND